MIPKHQRSDFLVALAHSFTILSSAEIQWVSMAQPTTPLPLTSSRADQIFPTLTSVEIERIATQGRKRKVRSGEVLVEHGDRAIPFFVVISGELESGAADMRNRNAHHDRQGWPVHWRNQHTFGPSSAGADSCTPHVARSFAELKSTVEKGLSNAGLMLTPALTAATT